MRTTLDRETAKIYAFPTKGRAKVEDLRDVARPVPLAARISTECGAGWYHEAAIEDARPSPKR
jgi:hypothetical protein